MADEQAFKLKIIAPDRVFYEGDVVMVELSTTEGEIGILKRHIPLTAVIAPGVLYIKEAKKESKSESDSSSLRSSEEGIKVASLISGFLEILPDQVTILAEVVEWPQEIDVNRAEEAKLRAERRLAERDPGSDLNRAELALRRSVARLEAVNKRGM